VNSHDGITEQKDWDAQWQRLSHARTVPVNDPILGANGSLMRVVRMNIGDIQGMRVLELGGASSYFLLTLAKFGGAQAFAVDYSSIGIEHLREIFRANRCEVEARVADIFEHDFPEETFDLIVHWGLIEHFKNPGTVLKVCTDHLAPGGKIFFTVPNMEAVGASMWKKWDTADWDRHIYHTSASIGDACDKMNLRLVREFFWGPPLLFNIGYWRKNGVFSLVTKQFVRALSLLNRCIPFYHYGVNAFSAHRTFLVESLADR
jgi:SAM-dependent methyltransferase